MSQKEKERKVKFNLPIDWQGSKLTDSVRNLAVSTDQDNDLKAIPVVLMDVSGATAKIQTGQTVSINGGTMDIKDPVSGYQGVIQRVTTPFGTYDVLQVFPIPLMELETNGTRGFAVVCPHADWHKVSAANSANQILLYGHFTVGLVIDMTTSAGTATLLVEVSTNGVDFKTVDSIAAAASTIKIYAPTTVGATRAIPPLLYFYIQITAGAAGAGNTTTLDVSIR